MDRVWWLDRVCNGNVSLVCVVGAFAMRVMHGEYSRRRGAARGQRSLAARQGNSDTAGYGREIENVTVGGVL